MKLTWQVQSRPSSGGLVQHHHRVLWDNVGSPYNAIFGRPWIHMIKAVPSSYHQLLQYLTPTETTNMQGNQAMSCTISAIAIAITEQRKQILWFHWRVRKLGQQAKRRSWTIPCRPLHPEQALWIRKRFSANKKVLFKKFISNLDVLRGLPPTCWASTSSSSATNSPSIAVKLVKQNLRKMNEEKTQALGDKVD